MKRFLLQTKERSDENSRVGERQPTFFQDEENMGLLLDLAPRLDLSKSHLVSMKPTSIFSLDLRR